MFLKKKKKKKKNLDNINFSLCCVRVYACVFQDSQETI